MSRERILILFGADSRLGWGPSCRLARAFVKNGHEVLHIDFPRRLWEISGGGTDSPEGDGGVMWESLRGLPVTRMPSLTSANCALIKKQVESILDRRGFCPTVLWVYSPCAPLTVLSIRERYAPKRVAYHCADDRIALASRSGGALAASRVDAAEKRIMKLSDVIYCVSPTLCERKRGAAGGATVELLTNGIDGDIFRPSTLPLPEDVADLPGRRIGYVGSVNWWLDLRLAARCAKRYPEFSFYFVGPSDADLSAIRGLPNVRILGPRPFSEVAAYVSAADLLINPVRDVDFTRYCNSMKVMQYVAMGKPVVAMDFAGSDDYFGLVRQTTDPEEFIRMVGETEENTAGREERRKLFSKRYAWTEIAERALMRLDCLGAAI